MSVKHWTENDLVDALYGIGREDGHLETCPECQAAWQACQRRREALAGAHAEAGNEIPAAFLAAQRRSIYQRMGETAHRWIGLRLASAMALLGMLMVGLLLYRPDQPPRSAHPQEISDTQLVNDIASMVDSPLPQPMTPVKNLFEED